MLRAIKNQDLKGQESKVKRNRSFLIRVSIQVWSQFLNFWPKNTIFDCLRYDISMYTTLTIIIPIWWRLARNYGKIFSEGIRKVNEENAWTFNIFVARFITSQAVITDRHYTESSNSPIISQSKDRLRRRGVRPCTDRWILNDVEINTRLPVIMLNNVSESKSKSRANQCY